MNSIFVNMKGGIFFWHYTLKILEEIKVGKSTMKKLKS
jgi:hypothetical protein